MQIPSLPATPPMRPNRATEPPPQSPEPPQDGDQVSLSKGAFAEGISAGAELIADTTGVVAGGAAGLSLGATAAALTVAGLGIAAGPVATGLILLGFGSGAVLGAWGGATLLDKVSSKLGQWGSQLAPKIGLSEKTGEAVGRAGLALALTSPITLTLTSGAALSAAPVAGAFLLVGGLAHKAVMSIADLFHSQDS